MFLKTHALRLAVCAVLVLSVFVTPLLTQAQYRWTLNGYTVLQAKEFYFSSNYLKDSSLSSKNETTGWDGISSPIKDIEIQNYDNALLANKEGENVYYNYSWSIETYVPNADGTTFTKIDNSDIHNAYRITGVELTDSNGAKTQLIPSDAAQEKYFSNSTTGTIIGNGSPKKDTYKFTVSIPEPSTVHNEETGQDETVMYKPAFGTYIIVKMNAYNTKENGSESDSFYRNLSHEFKFVVTSSAGYVSRFDIEETEGTKDFVLNIGTENVPDMSGKTQTVVVWWANKAISPNTFNKLFMEMNNSGNYHSEDPIYKETFGLNDVSSIYITGLGSKATRQLNFYKNNYTGADNVDISRTDLWFNENLDDLILKDSMPTDTAITNGVLMGYYVLSDTSN